MKKIQIIVFAAVLGLVQALSRAEAQNLADIARQEKQRRSLMIEHAPVLTNEDLSRGTILSPDIREQMAAARAQRQILNAAAPIVLTTHAEIQPEPSVVIRGIAALPSIPGSEPVIPSLVAPLKRFDDGGVQEQEVSLGQLARQIRAKKAQNRTEVASTGDPAQKAPDNKTAPSEVMILANEKSQLTNLTIKISDLQPIPSGHLELAAPVQMQPVLHPRAAENTFKSQNIDVPVPIQPVINSPLVWETVPAAQIPVSTPAFDEKSKPVAAVSNESIQPVLSKRIALTIARVQASIDAMNQQVSLAESPVVETKEMNEAIAPVRIVEVPEPVVPKAEDHKTIATLETRKIELPAPASVVLEETAKPAVDDQTLVTDPESKKPFVVQVKKGESLWQLARKYLGSGFNWSAIWRANREIKNPSHIEVGQSITIPNQIQDTTNVVSIAKGRNKTKRS